MKQLALGVRLRAEAVFASFAPGQNVELLAALQSAEPVPLWLWGPRGAGKTHLLQATCAAAATGAAYFPCDRTLALPPEALAGFEHNRILCLDDVDAVAGDASFEQALFRLFNAALESGAKLIFAAAGAPRQSAWALHDWSSRAAACLIYQVRELDDAGLIEAMSLRAAQRGLKLPLETAEYLLHRMPRDVHSLLGFLDHLDEASLAAQRRLTVPFIRAVLEKSAGT